MMPKMTCLIPALWYNREKNGFCGRFDVDLGRERMLCMKEEKSKLLQELAAKVKELACGGLCVAFSGDDGSALLLKLAMEAQARVLAVTFHTPLAPAEEADAAQARAKALGAEEHLLHVDVLRDARIASNTPSRCYYCRRMQFEALSAFAASRGVFSVCDGACADAAQPLREDKVRALRELGVRSPLRECGVTRAQARALLRELSEAPGETLAPCLAQRLPFDTPLEKAELQLIADGERLLRGLRLERCYLYLHGGLARIVAGREQAASILAAARDCVTGLKGLGFSQVTLDLAALPSPEEDAPAPMPERAAESLPGADFPPAEGWAEAPSAPSAG